MGHAGTLARQIRWYWGSLMGDNHYRRYLEHHARAHDGTTPMTEREYWRHRHARTDAAPGARCC